MPDKYKYIPEWMTQELQDRMSETKTEEMNDEWGRLFQQPEDFPSSHKVKLL